jgi:formate/nitrite transporter FocA (FNT family)
MRTRRSQTAAIAAPLVIGLIGLTELMHRPRFASIHAVDVLQLLASGMCFGVALVALVMLLRGPRAS